MEASTPRMHSHQGWIFSSFAACALALFLKSPDAFLNPQFWAEDGAIFYAQQYGKLWPQISTPYAGYLHFIPRLFAWLLSPIPPLYLPLSYNLSALLIDAICVTYAINSLSRVYGAAISFFSFFLLPNIGDIFGTLTNVQWFMQFPLILMVIRPGTTQITNRIHKSALFVLILFASLTGPFCLVGAAALIAAFITKAALRRINEKPFLIVKLKYACDMILENVQPFAMVALLIGAAIQLCTVLTNTAHTPDNLYALTPDELLHFGLPDYFSVYSYTVNHPFYWVHVAILGVLAAIALLNLIFFLRDESYVSGVTMFLLAIGSVQPILAFKKQHSLHTLTSVSHYYYFFGVICFCSTAILVNRFFPNRALSVKLITASAFSFLFLWKPHYLVRPFLTPMAWTKYADQILAGQGDVVIPLNPGWRAVIPVEDKEVMRR